jgi:anti-sigma factor RsiW
LGRIASLRVATGMLRRVERAGPHLSYEQLETLVDGKGNAPMDAAVQTHLDGCDACAHELAEMQGYAATLSASIEHRDMPSPSLLSRLLTRMRSPRG